MLAKLTPTLAGEATWIRSQWAFSALEALWRHLLIKRTSELGSSWSTAPLASSKSERAAVMGLEGGQVYCLGGGLRDRPLANAKLAKGDLLFGGSLEGFFPWLRVDLALDHFRVRNL